MTTERCGNLALAPQRNFFLLARRRSAPTDPHAEPPHKGKLNRDGVRQFRRITPYLRPHRIKFAVGIVLITLSGVLYPMIADGQAKMKEQRISKGLKQYSATLLDKDKKRLAKILEPFFHKARTPTPFTSRLIAGRAPARPTNRRLAV